MVGLGISRQIGTANKALHFTSLNAPKVKADVGYRREEDLGDATVSEAQD